MRLCVWWVYAPCSLSDHVKSSTSPKKGNSCRLSPDPPPPSKRKLSVQLKMIVLNNTILWSILLNNQQL